MNPIVHRLEKISLFNPLKDDPEALEQIAAIIKVRTYPADTYIIREGQSGHAMYILNRGTVRVEKQTVARDTFTVVNLTDEENVFFGEMALLDDDERSASVLTITDVECFEIGKAEFALVCAQNTHLGYHIVLEIARSLAARLRKTTLDTVTLIGALIDEDSLAR
jgi:CRP/FNR family transcriptional regulator, cyclic AMP receptor protein